MVCINTESAEYQILEKRSGLSADKLTPTCGRFMDTMGRLPHLDEVPHSNSKGYLEEELKIRKSGGAKLNTLLETTGSLSILEANQHLNTIYRDLEIEVSPLGDEDVMIHFERRPDSYNRRETGEPNITEVNNSVFFTSIINKLNKLYGINVIPITTDLLMTEQWKDKVGDAKNTNAFVYNGNVYINTDIADVDAPIHEMLHLFLGSMRFENPNLYFSLVNSVLGMPNYEYKASEYLDRTQSDVNEEIFVSELAKHLTGLDSILSEVDLKTIYELFYSIDRVLDTILMGDVSTKLIPRDELTLMNLKEIATKVSSTALNNTSFDGAYIHRVLANKKTELFQLKKLTEYCN